MLLFARNIQVCIEGVTKWVEEIFTTWTKGLTVHPIARLILFRQFPTNACKQFVNSALQLGIGLSSVVCTISAMVFQKGVKTLTGVIFTDEATL
jgi:hypothetical protein